MNTQYIRSDWLVCIDFSVIALQRLISRKMDVDKIICIQVEMVLFLSNKDKNLLSRVMRKTSFCICDNKGADQLRSNCEADQQLCFLYMDSTIPLLSKSKIFSL